MAKKAQLDAVRPVLNALDAEAAVAEHVIDAVVENADKAADVVEAGLETVADVVPEVLEKTVHVTADVAKRGVRGIRNPKTAAIVIGVGCVVAGAGLGVLAHQLLKKRLEKQFEERLERELEEMRIFYSRRNKEGKFATPRDAAEALAASEALEKYQGDNVVVEITEIPRPAPHGDVDESAAKNQAVRYDKVVTDSEAAEAVRGQVTTISQLEPATETETRNIFVDGKPLVDDDWDAEAEEARRNPAFPYVITHDEFMENNYEHPQHSLTYYAGDDVLVDERDEMIDDIESLIGTDNLTRFGSGSRDPNIVYIRNEKREADFEVALSKGKFSEEVMGLRHSDDSSRLRRARWGDNE